MVKHPVILRGVGAQPLEDQAPPVLVRRTDADFVTGVLDQLRDKRPLLELGAPTSGDYRAGRLHLLQPIHRTFHLVLLEAVCKRPGRPRLNPRDIESAGFVVRRVSSEHPGNPSLDQPWQRAGSRILGWNALGDEHWRLDPDPVRRPLRALRAPPSVQQALLRLRAEREPPTEDVTPLFVAPPDVCEAAGKTILYGVVTTTSSEERDQPLPDSVDPGVVEVLLPEFLRAGSGNYQPRAGATFVSVADVIAAEEAGGSGTFDLFLVGLRSLHSVWRVFSSTEGAAFRQLLNEVNLWFYTVDDGWFTQALGDYLESAAAKLIDERPQSVLDGTTASSGVLVPAYWPYPNADLAGRIASTARASLEAHLARIPPRIKRFDERDAAYRLHAFVRVRCQENCPAEIQWAPPSEPFSIAAWWENGGPLHTVSLPDVDKDSVKSLRPNVAFALPPKLANLLNRSSPDKLVEGEGSLSGDPSLGWICSFSLPIITLCAFIVLNIFLGLFNLIFQWMFYIKICLPFPKFNSPPKP